MNSRIATGLSAALLTATLATPALAAPCPTRASWPTESFPDDSATTKSARATEVSALEAYAFPVPLQGTETDRSGAKGRRTDALLIIKGGKVIYERYDRSWTPTLRHEAWSVSKSVTEALVGIAVRKGALALTDSVCTHLPLDRKESCSVTVQNLLEFGSGFDWREGYENGNNQTSSVLAMLYGQGRHDMAQFVGSHRLRAAPGTAYRYSTGESTLLAAVVDEALVPKLGQDYPWTELFDKVGMKSAVFERDAKGHLIGGARFFANARDYARFGYLYLNDGCWNTERILPENWVAETLRVGVPFQTTPQSGGTEGRQWWVNTGLPDMGIPTPWPDAPADTYAAIGHWGQYVAVIPSLDTVAVRLGDTRESAAFDENIFFKLVAAVAQ